jgi:hypothetical protein
MGCCLISFCIDGASKGGLGCIPLFDILFDLLFFYLILLDKREWHTKKIFNLKKNSSLIKIREKIFSYMRILSRIFSRKKNMIRKIF